MTTADILSNLRPITVECLTLFEPFYTERAKHYVYPRFMQSVCALIDLGHTFYKILRAKQGSLLIIYKRTKIYGKLGVQMPVCPISLTGSVADEREAMQAALRVGISLRVTTEDITRYAIPRKLCSDGTGPLVPANYEFIYDARSGSEMSGKKYRRQRYQTNLTVKNEGFSQSQGAHPQADALVKAWDERYRELNGTKTDQANLWAVCKQGLRQGGVAIRNIIIDGVLQCVSVCERVAPNHYIIVFRIRNYESDLHDVGSAMQWIDCTAALTETGDGYLNNGLADTDGLIRSKESMMPCRHQKIYTVKTAKTNSITLSQYFK